MAAISFADQLKKIKNDLFEEYTVFKKYNCEKKINIVVDFFLDKNIGIVFLIILTLLFVVFKQSIINFYTDKIIPLIAFKNLTSWFAFNAAYFIALIGILLYFLKKCVNKFYFSFEYIYLTTTISTLYIVYFRKSQLCHELGFCLYYCDIIPLGGFFYISLYIKQLYIYIANYKLDSSFQILYEDFEIPPINPDDKNIDKLSRHKILNPFYDIIKEQTFEKAFSVGVIGKWGSGKTTFINDLREKLLILKEVNIISYNPWHNHHNSNLAFSFFDIIENELKIYHSQLKNGLREYVKLISDSKSKEAIQLISKTAEYILNKNTSIEQQFDSINNLLKKINRKVFVFIDDLDRLTAEEIMQLLKLIRNTANFHNFIYIVALDKAYISKMLAIQDSEFIEKFFQLEICLNAIEPKTLKDELILLINEAKPKLELKGYDLGEDFEKLKDETLIDSGIFDVITNFRDIKKLTNSFIIHYSYNNIDYNIIDFILIEVIKLKFNQVYHLIYYSREKFFDFEKDPIVLKVGERKTELILYFETNKEKLQLTEQNIYFLNKIFNFLFSPRKERRDNSIVNVNRFSDYFTYAINAKITQREFEKYIKDTNFESDKIAKSKKLLIDEASKKELKFKLEHWKSDHQNVVSALGILFAEYSFSNLEFSAEIIEKIYEKLSLIKTRDQKFISIFPNTINQDELGIEAFFAFFILLIHRMKPIYNEESYKESNKIYFEKYEQFLELNISNAFCSYLSKSPMLDEKLYRLIFLTCMVFQFDLRKKIKDAFVDYFKKNGNLSKYIKYYGFKKEEMNQGWYFNRIAVLPFTTNKYDVFNLTSEIIQSITSEILQELNLYKESGMIDTDLILPQLNKNIPFENNSLIVNNVADFQDKLMDRINKIISDRKWRK